MAKEIFVPDIGDFSDVEVIEVLVNTGDTINAEDSLITVESDKAAMEIPAPEGGVIKEMKINVGDRRLLLLPKQHLRQRRTRQSPQPSLLHLLQNRLRPPHRSVNRRQQRLMK